MQVLLVGHPNFGVYVHGTGEATGDGCFLSVVAHSLTGEEGRSTVAELNDDGAVDCLCRFEHGINGAAARAVYSGDGEFVFVSVAEQFGYFVAV